MAIYTENVACDIVELFDDLLVENGIRIPSEEDAEREEDNEAALYGMVYFNLVSKVENMLIDIARRAEHGEEIIPHVLG